MPSEGGRREALVDRTIVGWSLAGASAGGVVGLSVGLAIGFGSLSIRGLAPLQSWGASIPALVFASAGISLGGFAGILRAKVQSKQSKKSRGAHHEMPGYWQVRAAAVHGDHRTKL